MCCRIRITPRCGLQGLLGRGLDVDSVQAPDGTALLSLAAAAADLARRTSRPAGYLRKPASSCTNPLPCFKSAVCQSGLCAFGLEVQIGFTITPIPAWQCVLHSAKNRRSLAGSLVLIPTVRRAWGPHCPRATRCC